MPVTRTLPPIATQPVSVLLLSRDAGAHAEAGLNAWLDYLDARGPEHELLLVDDGSMDGTVERAEAVAASRPRLRVLRHSSPRGEGAALRTGVSEAKMPLLFVSLLCPKYRPENLGILLDRTEAPPSKVKEIDKAHVMGGFRAGARMPMPLRILGFLCAHSFPHRVQFRGATPSRLARLAPLGWLARDAYRIRPALPRRRLPRSLDAPGHLRASPSSRTAVSPTSRCWRRRTSSAC